MVCEDPTFLASGFEESFPLPSAVFPRCEGRCRRGGSASSSPAPSSILVIAMGVVPSSSSRSSRLVVIGIEEDDMEKEGGVSGVGEAVVVGGGLVAGGVKAEGESVITRLGVAGNDVTASLSAVDADLEEEEKLLRAVLAISVCGKVVAFLGISLVDAVEVRREVADILVTGLFRRAKEVVGW